MNVNTGELFRINPEISKRYAEMLASGDGQIMEVPAEFSEEAEKLLGKKDRVFADMTEDTLLVNWAKSHQMQVHTGPNRAQRRQMAKESRRKNRR